MMRVILAILFCLMCAVAEASTVCMSPSATGGTGTKSGADWNNIADFTASMTRGNTYYLCDGTKSGTTTFATAVSGTTLITVKKATVADHGPATGWVDTLGDGEALFNDTVSFTSDYWVFDGQIGGGPSNWVSGHGFHIHRATSGQPVIDLTTDNDNITISHVNIEGDHGDGDGGTPTYNQGIACGAANFNLLISYCVIHDCGASLIRDGMSSSIVEYNCLYHNESSGGEHSSAIQFGQGAPNTHLRYNLFLQAEGTGCVTHDSEFFNLGSDFFYVYGNVFVDGYNPTGGTLRAWNVGNGIIAGWTGGNNEMFKNIIVYNNGFINMAQPFTTPPTSFSGNIAKNNYLYNCTVVDFSRFGTHDYNHFADSGGTYSEAHGTSSVGNSFTDYVNGNFALQANTTSGQNVGSPYDHDWTTAARTTWTRGALEFGSGGGGGGGTSSSQKAKLSKGRQR